MLWLKSLRITRMARTYLLLSAFAVLFVSLTAGVDAVKVERQTNVSLSTRDTVVGGSYKS